MMTWFQFSMRQMKSSMTDQDRPKQLNRSSDSCLQVQGQNTEVQNSKLRLPSKNTVAELVREGEQNSH